MIGAIPLKVGGIEEKIAKTQRGTLSSKFAHFFVRPEPQITK
jgi:hypothetical protein